MDAKFIFDVLILFVIFSCARACWLFHCMSHVLQSRAIGLKDNDPCSIAKMWLALNDVECMDKMKFNLIFDLRYWRFSRLKSKRVVHDLKDAIIVGIADKEGNLKLSHDEVEQVTNHHWVSKLMGAEGFKEVTVRKDVTVRR